MDQRLRDKLDKLPESPGVYLFKDEAGKVIYVGKAKNLSSRIRSYFQPTRTDQRAIAQFSEQLVADIETMIVENEKEAILQEGTQLKEHRPRYNVRFIDDKDFLHLRIDLGAQWPRLELVRRPRTGERGTKLFGPYHSARSARQTMQLVSRFFKLRTCQDRALHNRSRPCLLYQMKRCPGPCVHEVDREAYLEQVRLATLFLAGRHAELEQRLEEQMRAAAASLAFERAAHYRDLLRAVTTTLTSQNVVHLSDVDQDVFGLAREAGVIQLVVMRVRHGRITGHHEEQWKGFDLQVPEDELLSSLVMQYYQGLEEVPDEVLVPAELEDVGGLGELLGERRGRRTVVLRPQRGHKAALLRIACANAQQLLSQRRRTTEDREALLSVLAQKLGLPAPPRTIECVDIAHHQQGRAVAAMAVLREGLPDAKGTRSFTIKTAKTGDDYGGMYEVLSRRFRRAREEEAGWELPDLLVVDGGRGQLSVAQAALKDVGFSPSSVALVGLAKERSARRHPDETSVKDALEERIYLPGRVNPIAIRGSSPLLLLCQVRDEAHRLAGKLLTSQRRERLKRSELDEIKGIGPKLRRALLRDLGSVEQLRRADVTRLAAVPGVGPALAQRIHDHFRGTSRSGS